MHVGPTRWGRWTSVKSRETDNEGKGTGDYKGHPTVVILTSKRSKHIIQKQDNGKVLHPN